MTSIFDNLQIEPAPPRPLTPLQHALAIVTAARNKRIRCEVMGVVDEVPGSYISALHRRSLESVEHRLTDEEKQRVADVFCWGAA